MIGVASGLVLSGINRGFNVGRSALHSGTVGAAITAAAWGAKGLAVSTAWAEGEVHWETAASVALDLSGWLMDADDLRALNVNVPNTPRGELRGVRWATLAPVGAIRSAIVGIEEAADGEGFRVLTDHKSTDPAAAPQGSDRALVAGGWVTLTGLGGLAEWIPSGDSLDERRLAGLLGCRTAGADGHVSEGAAVEEGSR